MDSFIALIRLPVGNADWLAEFPDLPGCAASGGSLDETIEAARDALTAHIAELVACGHAVPPAREAADMLIDANEDPALARQVIGTVVTHVRPWPAAALRAAVARTTARLEADSLVPQRRWA